MTPAKSSKSLRLAGSFFGSGLSPVMPGTCGSVAAALVMSVPALWLDWPWWWSLAAALVLFVPFTWIADAVIRRFGEKDPGWFVLDEVIGVWLVPVGIDVLLPDTPLSRLGLIWIGCFFFRCFDILKPWPVRNLERIGGGFGIMIDDCMAAVYAWPCTFACAWLVSL